MEMNARCGDQEVYTRYIVGLLHRANEQPESIYSESYGIWIYLAVDNGLFTLHCLPTVLVSYVSGKCMLFSWS